MTDQNSAALDQNSTVEMHYRPDEIQEILSIKSAAYYERIKFLGIKAQKDKQGKAYLSQSQFDRLKRLDQYIQETGKMDGFEDSCSELIVSENALLSGSMSGSAAEAVETEQTVVDSQFEQLMWMAAELKAQEIINPHLLVQELASRMTEEDLPESLKAKVKQVKEAALPKHPGQIADQLLGKWRHQQRQDAIA